MPRQTGKAKIPRSNFIDVCGNLVNFANSVQHARLCEAATANFLHHILHMQYCRILRGATSNSITELFLITQKRSNQSNKQTAHYAQVVTAAFNNTHRRSVKNVGSVTCKNNDVVDVHYIYTLTDVLGHNESMFHARRPAAKAVSAQVS